MGAGHSFTAVAATDGLQLRLDGLTGITHVDRERSRVRVLAGTPLHVLNPALHALGLALPNLGDIDRQSLAGAISTGTHGTGIRLQGIAAAVSGLVLALADGTLVECSADVEPRVFQAARVGLGALGIITEVELQCVPAFRLHAKEFGADLHEVLERIDDDVEAHDHVDMHWFPLTDRVLVKHNDRVGDDHPGAPLPRWRALLDDDLLSNRVFELTNRAATAAPAIVPRLNAVAARLLGARDYTDDSWRVFVAERKVRFRESEYAVPRAAVARRRARGAGLAGAAPGAADLPAGDPVHRRRRHLAVHGLRAGERLRRDPPVPPDGRPRRLRGVRGDRGRARRAAALGQAAHPGRRAAARRSTRGSTTSSRCATSSTRGAGSPTPTSTTSSAPDPVSPVVASLAG